MLLLLLWGLLLQWLLLLHNGQLLDCLYDVLHLLYRQLFRRYSGILKCFLLECLPDLRATEGVKS